ncbi:hypothetical protein Cha6605_3397 [Chamaesiphon minutus PCC 6605]|uniref:Uncharacterized protein n=1 Tax=Chamaesiphon minutus (strain ATCC 27169 / PCC 6605) TaxID=1173020 RepID=K9UHW5_CHAP6|nr:hypothetical protein Cha6605_3397 [Chamaesiphon minutus PCC 6605]
MSSKETDFQSVDDVGFEYKFTVSIDLNILLPTTAGQY